MAANESCKDNPVLKRYGLDTSDRLLCVGEGDFGWSRSLSDLGFELIVASDILEIDSEHRKQNIQAVTSSIFVALNTEISSRRRAHAVETNNCC